MTENINNNENKVVISKEVRKKVWWRHQFLQGVMNYERMQNGGWAYSISPALEEIYTNKEDQSQALKRHLEFYNTHPYVSNSVMGVTLAMEEERANGADIDDGAINGVKIGLMGPLAGVGDPVFWFTIRPILGALGASLALTGNIVGPLIFFLIWNAMRLIFEWKSQEFGYRTGNEIIKDLSGGLLGRVTLMASILGMFIIGALVQRWVSINFTINVSSVTQQPGTYIDWATLPAGAEGIKMAISKALEIGPTALDSAKVTTLQQNLDSLIPGLSALLLTLGICKLLKKNISPIAIILALFVVGILARVFHIM
ncbi:PTS system mannose/fructose/sorbose family transporter subunit IID [Anaerococcus degeneri]|uniref:PTS system mannose/fructose/sorbose family transporter subunit IID n=1 Tax=Anaerococcus degeneri TaxID=361500 RepID=A0ABS7YXX7_9FIRM|nr:PTS system mannose/fructose/sorbose family transporter subunit IID [Anaerococcus degeneri]MBP2016204.1 PTS system mannose-specific IID component [Anaerococcus degeneri]MCA2096592.1 PTS system mannose/fructose/sorbose family transporter subunit IID [Anaerococcus degeneri]